MPAITVDNVHKKFRVYQDKSISLKEKLLFQKRNRYSERFVLNGVSFEVEKGEAIGIVGENGCGKSTLLKLMTRIMYPDQGSITMNGRVSSLIELGAGFHPDMSGRENIFTNASIFGLSHREIERRLKDIIAFSELGEFIDNPVRTYSSGMYMRLAFSVAINVDADILLIDEILAVGDASFQAKCFSRLREIKASGTTIAIVSHSLGQIEQICERSIWIDGGVIREIGEPKMVHPSYMEFMGEKRNTIDEAVADAEKATEVEHTEEEASPAETQDSAKRWGSRDIEIKQVRILDAEHKERSAFKTGDPMKIEIQYKVNKPVKRPVIGVGFFRNDGTNCYGTNTNTDRLSIEKIDQDGLAVFSIEKMNFLEGEYLLDVALESEDGFAYDYYREVKTFRVYSVLSDIGVTRLDHCWKL